MTSVISVTSPTTIRHSLPQNTKEFNDACSSFVTQAGDLGCFKCPSCAKPYISKSWYRKHVSKCPKPTGAITGWTGTGWQTLAAAAASHKFCLSVFNYWTQSAIHGQLTHTLCYAHFPGKWSKQVSKVWIYIAHYQKISNALSTSRQYFAQKICLQLTPKHVETQCWVAMTVR